MRNILPELRAERGWTQTDLAKHLHVSRQSVNAIETGRYEPSLSLAFGISRVFGKSIEEIFDPRPVAFAGADQNFVPGKS